MPLQSEAGCLSKLSELHKYNSIGDHTPVGQRACVQGVGRGSCGEVEQCLRVLLSVVELFSPPPLSGRGYDHTAQPMAPHHSIPPTGHCLDCTHLLPVKQNFRMCITYIVRDGLEESKKEKD